MKKIDKEINNDSKQAEIIEDSLTALLEHKLTLIKLDELIESDIEIEELDNEIQSSTEYKESILFCKSRATRYLHKCNRNSVVLNESKIETVIPDTHIKTNAKLPRISLNTFSGDILKFQEFWPQYKVAIHENKNLEDVENTYLKTLLTDSAAKAISGLPLTDENYAKAIEILSDRYGKNDILISAHTNKLLNLKPVQRSNDIIALRNLYDEICVQIRSLESLKVKSDSFNCLLLPILYKCIPNDLVLHFHREQSTKEEPTVTELLNFLKREIESREKSYSVTNIGLENMTSFENKPKQKFPKYFPETKNKNSSAFTLNALTEILCPFCNEKHDANSCNYDLNQRKIALSRQAKCFRCYKKYHKKQNCRLIGIKCTICNSKTHLSSLCNKSMNQMVTGDSGKTKSAFPLMKSTAEGRGDEIHSERVLVSNINCKSDKYIYFQTLKCELIGKNKSVNIRVLLDSASQRSFINKRVSNMLNLEVVGNESLRINTFAAKNSIFQTQNRVKVLLKDNNSKNVICLEALEIEHICSDIIRAPNSELYEEFKNLGIKLSDIPDDLNTENKIDLLIGSDYYWTIMTGKYKRISPTLMLNETKLGWTLHGRFSERINVNNLVGAMYISIWDENKDEEMNVQLQRFWDVESLGITQGCTDKNLCDKQILEQFEESIKFENNRYKVKLPIKYDKFDLPNNYEVAKKRFEGLIKRFKNNPALFKEYKEIIHEYLSLGIVEIVKSEEIGSFNENLIYHLPHHPVIRKDKQTTKLRIVFDASSHAPSEPSLNDILFPGPNLNSDLFDLILQFRSDNIAVVSDIEKAFLQICLSENDRDMTRFLWIEDLPQNNNTPAKFIIMKMCRVLFGVTSSPFLLGAVIKHHTKKFETLYPETCSIINSSMYVDDLLFNANTVDEAFKIATEAFTIFKHANMYLRKWQSNSSLLKEHLKAKNMDVCSVESTNANPFKILGVIWDTEEDSLKLDSQSLLEFVNCKESTKRTIIRAVGRIFDPIGILSPFTIIIKMIFQATWEHGIDWDQKLPESLERKWYDWCAQIPYLNKLKIPRYYFRYLQTYKNIEIHCFSDASEKAFGSVIYLRFEDDSNTKTCFVTSKSRLAPIKRMTLPRLELIAAVIGARLCDRVMSALKLNFRKVYLWSDSNIVLHWIKGSCNNWKPFVSNRVSEIQSLTNPSDWRHCPGSSNPADRLTRGMQLSDLQNDDLWWSGPPWLIANSNLWPKEVGKINEAEKQSERRTKVISQNLSSSESHKPLIEIERFSSLLKLIRVVARVKRFIFNLRNSIKREGNLSAEELAEAKEILIKEIQLRNYREEIECLKKGDTIKKNSKIYCLCPYLDEAKILRISSRLSEGTFTSNEISPILLPKNERFTELLIIEKHEILMHSGVTLTLADIRKYFWIPQGRQLIRRIIGKCLICKKYNAKPANQLTGQLPKDRISESPPFSIIGLDFAGPIIIKLDKKETTKSYIVLFTCAITRAIHLEAVMDMTTKSFLMSFRRFTSRRGNCKIIYSDNAKCFKAANKELQQFSEIIKSQELQDFIANKGVSWKFIIERAPWWGGFYERLVKCVKEPLKKILGRSLITFEELRTILTEIEFVVNMRPLTYTTSDIGEPEPLTPAHFLQFGQSEFNFPLHFADLENKLSTKETLLRRQQYQTKLLKQLWTKWKEQYLLNLNSAHNYKTSEKHRNLKVGDIVLVEGTTKSKLLWDLAKIQEVICGRDNLIRACVVKTAKGLFRKPIQLLYPFELDVT